MAGTPLTARRSVVQLLGRRLAQALHASLQRRRTVLVAVLTHAYRLHGIGVRIVEESGITRD